MDRVLGIFLCKLISQGRHVYALIWLLWTLLGLGYAHTPLLIMHLIAEFLYLDMLHTSTFSQTMYLAKC